MIKKANYDQLDFARLYREQKKVSTFKTKTYIDWDKKALISGQNMLKGNYPTDFLSRVDFSGCQSALDFGCGPGTLSLLAAPYLHEVVACDYAPNMLTFLNDNAHRQGINNIRTLQLAYEDDWDAVPECDLVFASRCLELDDIQMGLKKLISKAKQRVYLTYKVGRSFLSDDIDDLIERPIVPKPDYIYVINILYQLGIHPKVDYIECEDKRFMAESADELLERVRWSLGELSCVDEQKIRTYFQTDFQHTQRIIKWAFISFDVN
ncbi:class I SAM-dependent methyltransferase [Spirabiliibacterium falconis]|uniref:class I SAM-dependent methyltransferase n=1 Tax=Spirabiliibacterium falconis TaxID=572023 RepID=UPI001AAD4484|nr:class I SAM-dependent methyltransferase [Spirabiliibacterium falconis]MBE2894063.1 class I SAM-dependent methyltransferase [Spirabiliibacterium falconis]